ncbi:MAG: hypothetical protein KC444_07395, partial [Nitrosopumilus sp.]|nr:hypothetical protein [Nitrosopumilus sp.]
SEYNSIKDEQIHTTDKNKKEEHNKKASELSERIQDIKSELDNVKIQMALENNSDEVLGRFHKNMMVLEHEIIKKAKENGIQFTALIIAPSVIIRKMNDANLISDERKEQFNSIRSFRNRITHGTISPTDKEIESQIKSIIELTDVIKKIK